MQPVNRMMSLIVAATAASLLFSVVACERPAEETAAANGVGGGPVVEVDIAAVGNELRYGSQEIRVPEGSTVRLTLANPATDETLFHNWVLVRHNMAEEIGSRGGVVGAEHDYVPDHPDVIAYTPLAGPGEVAEVTFEAPPAGTYSFVCSYPGHHMTMHGVFIVESQGEETTGEE